MLKKLFLPSLAVLVTSIVLALAHFFPTIAQTTNNYLYLNGNVGIGTNNPIAPLSVGTGGTTNFSVDSLGNVSAKGNTTITGNLNVTGTITSGGGDSSVACQSRRGVWSGSSCQEFAYTTGACQYGSCTCNAGYHACSWVDLYSGGFQSLRRPGYDPSAGGYYTWVGGGAYPGQENSFFYPWGYNASNLTCAAGTHYMMQLAKNANGGTAWGCYLDTYTTANMACCANNQ